MIDKADFYHGAALVRVIEDERCESIRRRDSAYIVNDTAGVCVKYSTKASSPWRFTLTSDDVRYCERALADGLRVVIALVCGGDGVCALSWAQVCRLTGGAPNWIASKRAFNGCYGVSGSSGTLDRKVARNQWPGILFSEE